MADREAPGRDEPKRPVDSDDADADDYAFREPEMEWGEPGPDVWGFLERVWRRVKRADKAA
jgi:broad specificity phosphatase PhoE